MELNNWEEEVRYNWEQVGISIDLLIGDIKLYMDKARQEGRYEGFKLNGQEGLANLIRQEERQRIISLIEPYIENCKKAITEGGMSQFGSASGGMMAKSALEAFEELKEKINEA